MAIDEGRKAKEKVRKKYPRSVTLNEGPGLAVVKDLSTKEIIGYGQTFDEVWIDAAKNLK